MLLLLMITRLDNAKRRKDLMDMVVMVVYNDDDLAEDDDFVDDGDNGDNALKDSGMFYVSMKKGDGFKS
jgi:hypothetical protein